MTSTWPGCSIRLNLELAHFVVVCRCLMFSPSFSCCLSFDVFYRPAHRCRIASLRSSFQFQFQGGREESPTSPGGDILINIPPLYKEPVLTSQLPICCSSLPIFAVHLQPRPCPSFFSKVFRGSSTSAAGGSCASIPICVCSYTYSRIFRRVQNMHTR